jgi:myo-inositol-1(or 4)-monophosphatase
MLNLSEALPVVSKIAKNAGLYLIENLGRVKEVEFKGERNLVTDIDKTSEKIIKDNLTKYFPGIPILGEELGGESAELCWVIDPLDGTNNYFHSYPVFCISIALVEKRNPLLGVIYDPNREELFTALKGKGAYMNGEKIHVSQTNSLKHSLLASGFYYEFKTQKDTNIEHFVDFLYQVQGIRRSGSAAIDMAYVACGRLDGFWELGLKPWDTSAGFLIVEEAGGKVTKFDGSQFDPFFPQIVASNSRIHTEMLRVLNRRGF